MVVDKAVIAFRLAQWNMYLKFRLFIRVAWMAERPANGHIFFFVPLLHVKQSILQDKELETRNSRKLEQVKTGDDQINSVLLGMIQKTMEIHHKNGSLGGEVTTTYTSGVVGITERDHYSFIY